MANSASVANGASMAGYPCYSVAVKTATRTDIIRSLTFLLLLFHAAGHVAAVLHTSSQFKFHQVVKC